MDDSKFVEVMSDDEKKWMKERRSYVYAVAILSFICGVLITHELVGSGRPLDWISILIGAPLGVAIVAAIKEIAKKSRRTEPDRPS